MAKYSTECKLKVVQEYLAGKGSYEALSKQHKIASRNIKTWVKVYEAFGSKGLERSRVQQTYTFEFTIEMLWSSVFVTRVSNKLMSNTSLRMAYDSRYKNAVVHGCMWYKQNAPLRDREIPHLDTHEEKFLRSSAY